MHDQNRPMYELEYPLPEITNAGADGLTLIVALQGYADAGMAVEGSADHLLASLDSRVLALFHTDELIDYRSRRPGVSLEHSEITHIEDLELSVRVLRDMTGRPFLLLSGPEPDLRWNAFTKAVAQLVEQYGVERTIVLYGAPMMVPHTRPMIISGHGNDDDLLKSVKLWDTNLTLPGSASLLLEAQLSAEGRKAAGFTAHVPHYVSASAYPEAILQLLRTIENAAQLHFPLGALEQDSRKVAIQLAEQTEESNQIQLVVHSLEKQYDEAEQEYHTREAHRELNSEALPTGDEIGAELEEFLAQLGDDEDGDPLA